MGMFDTVSAAHSLSFASETDDAFPFLNDPSSTGHRKTTQCKKGDSIADFLDKCRAHFPDLKNVGVDSMMYIKEDLIIPQHVSQTPLRLPWVPQCVWDDLYISS